MRVNTRYGPMEYSPEVFRSRVSAETYKYANDHVLAMSVTNPPLNISDYYYDQIFRTSAIKPIAKVDLTIKPILLPPSSEVVANNIKLVALTAAAEKKAATEYISPEAAETERLRILANTITPEQANQKLIDEQNDYRWKKALLEVAVSQEKYPDAIFLQGTKPELVEWEKTAADLGITIPLKAAEITIGGKVSGKVFDLNLVGVQNVVPAQNIQSQQIGWLDQIVNYIYKTLYKN